MRNVSSNYSQKENIPIFYIFYQSQITSHESAGMDGTQDKPAILLAPIYFPQAQRVLEIARIWGVRYIYDKEDNYETFYGVAWKNLRVAANCWISETHLAPNSPADLEKKYALDVASRKILLQKEETSAGGGKGTKRYWIHWEGNGGEPWCEWWEEDKVSLFAPDLVCQMETAPDFGVGGAASLDEDMDEMEMGLEMGNRDVCPTSILCWVDSILPEESDANNAPE